MVLLDIAYIVADTADADSMEAEISFVFLTKLAFLAKLKLWTNITTVS